MKDLKHIRRFNESEENLNISDVSDSENDFIMGRVIDLRKVCSKIANNFDFDSHPIYQEWRYHLDERCNGNNSGNLEWVGHDDRTPLINKFLLNNGFKKGEQIIYYVWW
jgi:hypothetical protein